MSQVFKGKVQGLPEDEFLKEFQQREIQHSSAPMGIKTAALISK
jgi:hypothetical protein